MSEIVLSNASNQYVADYSNGSLMTNFDPAMVQKVDSPTASSPPVPYHDGSQQYQDYAFQQVPLGYQPAAAVPMTYPVARFGYYAEQPPSTTAPPQQMIHHHHSSSPDSTSSPQTPPPSTAAAIATSTAFSHVLTAQALDATSSQLITPLVPSSTFTNSTTERVKETIARANSVPMEFYHTEFLEYSKETYEKKMDAKRNKRKRPAPSQSSSSSTTASSSSSNTASSDEVANKKKKSTDDDSDDDVDEEETAKEVEERGMSNAELRRQIHIQSEQKRRAQIKDGFDELRKHLPGCNNKKMSKAALLTRTVQQIQHLKNMQNELLSEVERLVQENESLKKFQHGVLQRQAMEKMYTF